MPSYPKAALVASGALTLITSPADRMPLQAPERMLYWRNQPMDDCVLQCRACSGMLEDYG